MLCSCSKSSKAEKLHDQGVLFYNHHKYFKAVEKLEAALEINPKQLKTITLCGDAYLKAGILRQEARADAEHIAAASVADVDFVISWNFKHVVLYEKISGYQAINLMNSYKEIRIYSPKEVVEDEEK